MSKMRWWLALRRDLLGWVVHKTITWLKKTKKNNLNCNQSNVLLARIIFSSIFKLLFSLFLCTPQMRSSVTWPFETRVSTSYWWSIVTMRLSSTVMEIWPFEVLPGRLFQEQRLVAGRSVGPQYYTKSYHHYHQWINGSRSRPNASISVRNR